jgi:flagellar biosynthesis chaperone FliJ
MSLRDKFLAFVEYQRAAEQSKSVATFEEANRRKLEILEQIELLEEYKWKYEGLDK